MAIPPPPPGPPGPPPPPIGGLKLGAPAFGKTIFNRDLISSVLLIPMLSCELSYICFRPNKDNTQTEQACGCVLEDKATINQLFKRL